MELKDGLRAAGASGRDLRGRCSIAGLLRTAAGGRVNLLCCPQRAREAQTEPHLPPRRRRPLSPIPFSRIPDPGPGRMLQPPLVRSAAMVTAPVELS